MLLLEDDEAPQVEIIDSALDMTGMRTVGFGVAGERGTSEYTKDDAVFEDMIIVSTNDSKSFPPTLVTIDPTGLPAGNKRKFL
jgi:hypothetical protein